MDDKQVNVVMKLILSPADYERYKKGLMGIDEQVVKIKPKIEAATAAYDKQAAKIKEVRTQMQGLREQAEKLQQLGMTIAIPSGAVLAGLLGAAQKYAVSQQNTERTAQRIVEIQKDFENITIRIGRVVAKEVLPFLEKAAKLAEKATQFAEKHPEIIAAALKISAAGVVVSGGIGLASQAMRVAGGVGSLGAQGLAGGSAEKAALSTLGGGGGGASAGMLAGVGAISLTVGAMIGKSIGDFVNKALGQSTEDTAQATAFKYANLGLSLVANGLERVGVVSAESRAGLVGWQNGVVDWLNGVDKAAEASKAASDEVERVAQFEAELTAARIKAQQAAEDLLSAEYKLRTAEFYAAEKRKETVEDGMKKIADIEAKGVQDRISILAKLIEDGRQAEYQYNQERSKIAAEGGREIAGIERESQKRIAQLRRDFEDQAENFTRSRDALGLVKATREFDEKVSQERQNANEEIAQRRADIALRLQDLATSYRYEQQQRQSAAQTALAEQAAAQKAALELERANQARILLELGAFYKQQIMILRMNTVLVNPQQWAPTHATGGYAPYGQYTLGDKPGGGRGGDEFVMTAATTRAAEQALGGRLDQNKLMQALTMNINMPQGGTLQMVRQMMAENNQALLGQLGQAFGAI